MPREAARVVAARTETWLDRPHPLEPFALVLLDPPYDFPRTGRVLERLAASPLVAPGALVVLESPRRPLRAAPDGLESLRTKRYGDTQVDFLQKSAPGAHGPVP